MAKRQENPTAVRSVELALSQFPKLLNNRFWFAGWVFVEYLLAPHRPALVSPRGPLLHHLVTSQEATSLKSPVLGAGPCQPDVAFLSLLSCPEKSGERAAALCSSLRPWHRAGGRAPSHQRSFRPHTMEGPWLPAAFLWFLWFAICHLLPQAWPLPVCPQALPSRGHRKPLASAWGDVCVACWVAGSVTQAWDAWAPQIGWDLLLFPPWPPSLTFYQGTPPCPQIQDEE